MPTGKLGCRSLSTSPAPCYVALSVGDSLQNDCLLVELGVSLQNANDCAQYSTCAGCCGFCESFVFLIDIRFNLIKLKKHHNEMFDFNLQFARNGADLTVELFRQLAEGGVNQNIIFSPFSVQTCIGLAFAGSQGETAEEIAKGLQFVSDIPNEVAECFQFVLEQYKNSELVKIANKVYVQDGKVINPEYATAITEQYMAEVENLNFGENVAAAQAINTWVKQKTAGKITELISSNCLNGYTRLVLLNAIHFKGDWEKKFNEAQTEEDDFWVGEEASVKLQYMHQKAKFGYGHFEDLDCTALEMPYKDSDLSMFVLLPNQRNGLKSLAEKLKTVNLIDLADNMNTEEVVVKFPKFKVEYSVELSETLQKMGINRMFTEDAEFTKMLESPESIFVSKVMHKASIEVNEEGTEAAAATGIIMMTRMMLMQSEFQADHPFLYMIWNKKNILFAGAFVNAPPAKE